MNQSRTFLCSILEYYSESTINQGKLDGWMVGPFLPYTLYNLRFYPSQFYDADLWRWGVGARADVLVDGDREWAGWVIGAIITIGFTSGFVV